MSYSAMHFIYPQMLPPWEFMPFLPVYYVCPPNQFHMQSMAAFQNDATLGNGMPQPIPQHLHQNHLLSAGPHQDPIDQRGRRRTAAPPNNNPHASSSSISNDHRNVSHHGQMGDFSNARSGLAGHLSLSTMPSYEHRSRATPRRTKRASAIRGHHIRKDVAQFVVAADGVEGGCPWKRYRTDGQLTANIPIPTSSAPSASAPTSASTHMAADEGAESTSSSGGEVDVPIAGDVDMQGELASDINLQ